MVDRYKHITVRHSTSPDAPLYIYNDTILSEVTTLKKHIFLANRFKLNISLLFSVKDQSQ